MNDIYQAAVYYCFAINITTLVLFGVDKLKAKKHWWRIPEATLLLFSLLGGSIGALCGMYLFRHKTQHKKFFIGVPFILIAQIALLVYLFYFKV